MPPVNISIFSSATRNHFSASSSCFHKWDSCKLRSLAYKLDSHPKNNIKHAYKVHTSNTHTKSTQTHISLYISKKLYTTNFTTFLQLHEKCHTHPQIYVKNRIFRKCQSWDHQLPCSYDEHREGQTRWHTKFHRALSRSFSNLAYSRRSWIVTRSFQRSSRSRPIRIIPAITPRTIGRTGTGVGHSEENMHLLYKPLSQLNNMIPSELNLYKLSTYHGQLHMQLGLSCSTT